jgi:hypothetical protein
MRYLYTDVVMPSSILSSMNGGRGVVLTTGEVAA